MNAIVLAVLAGLSWGIGEMFTKSVLHGGKVGPLAAISVRTTVELPILWLAYWMATRWWKTEQPGWYLADSSTLWKLVCGSGLVAGAAGMICFYSALSLGEISRIKPVAFSIAPATAVILGWLVLREPMTPQKAIAILLILAGVVLLTSGAGTSAAASAPH